MSSPNDEQTDREMIAAIFGGDENRERRLLRTILSLSKANAELGALAVEHGLAAQYERTVGGDTVDLLESTNEKHEKELQEARDAAELAEGKAHGLTLTLRAINAAWKNTQGGKARMGALVEELTKAFG